MQIDIRVMELLASKICHDLVSPVSAINNGVELIEDIGGSVVDEAMKLIGDSGITASRRLRLFRMAYGRAGSEDNLAIKDVRQVAEQYLAGGKVSLEWPEDQPSAELATRRGFVKTLLNLVVLAEETLAYGGTLALRSDGTDSGCRIEIIGRNAQLSPQLQEALEGTATIENLSPRSIQAYMVSRFAAQFDLNVTYDQSVPDHLQLVLHVPEAAVLSVPSLVNLF
ncbi:MAG: histidine phosphotransferase family protein [Alphaproteobacteria bacterium]